MTDKTYKLSNEDTNILLSLLNQYQNKNKDTLLPDFKNCLSTLYEKLRLQLKEKD